MAYASADAYAVKPGASEAGWTVREGVKYEWVVGPSTCPAPQVPEEIKAFERSAKARLKEAQEKENLVRSQVGKNGTGGAAAEAEAEKTAAAATEAAAAAAAAAAVADLSNPWLPFNASVFCERVGRGRRILFLGDSKQYQMVQALVNHMAWGWKGKRKPAKDMVTLEERPKACVDALGGNTAKMGHEFCQWFTFNSSVCPGFKVDFVRNDHLSLFDPKGAVFDHMPWGQPGWRGVFGCGGDGGAES
ncbi:unnamed protein product [Closterium sp. Naga37s-1]|nr:unnamed protein product [Closterium sp. Naga37s-1]